MFGKKITAEQSKNEHPVSNKIVNESDASPSKIEKLALPVRITNAIKVSQAKGEEKSAEVKNDGAYVAPAIQDPKIGSGYQMLSWSTPRTNQYSLANIRYDGPITLHPGYDRLGASFPVLDTSELAGLLKAGVGIYQVNKDDIESGAYKRAWNIVYNSPRPIPTSYNQLGTTPPIFGTFQSNPAVSIRSYHAPSWSAPQTNQYTDLNIRYVGPIAIPPGYDESGAPLPVLDTPEVAQAKSARLAELAEAGGDIYPAVHQAYPGLDNGDGASWSGSTYTSDKTNYDASSSLAMVNHKKKSSALARNQNQAKLLVGIGASSAVSDSSIISNSYQVEAPWLTTQAKQIASAYNKYNGPIAIPPGYDESGAPLPVYDNPDVAQLKAIYNSIYEKTLANLVANGLYDQQAVEHNIW